MSVISTLLLVSPFAVAAEFTAADLLVSPLSRESTLAILPDPGQVELVFLGESPHYSGEALEFLEEYLFPVLASSSSWVSMPETIRLISGTFYAGIKRFNAEASKQIRVAAVDVNHFPWAFREAVSLLELEPLLDYVGVDVLSTQFGAGRLPTLPESFVDRSQLARTHITWARREHPHLEHYLERLRSASAAIEQTRSQMVGLWDEDQIDVLLELLHYETMSALYRQAPRHALRERTMVDLARHGLAKFGLPGVAHLVGFTPDGRTHTFLAISSTEAEWRKYLRESSIRSTSSSTGSRVSGCRATWTRARSPLIIDASTQRVIS